MSTKGRITYRFDQQSGARVEQPQQEARRTSDASSVAYFQEELKFTSDIGTWNSPFQNDAHALEQLIREADGQLPRQQPKPRIDRQAEQAEPSQDQWDTGRPQLQAAETILLGDEEPVREAPLQAYSKRGAAPQVIDMYPQIEINEPLDNKRNRNGNQRTNSNLGSYLAGTGKRPSQGPSWFKVFVSVAGAIATGALFGYFVLTLFTGGAASDTEGTVEGSVPAVSGGVSGDGASPAVKANGGKTTVASSANGNQRGTGGAAAAASSSTVKLDLPAVTYYMLQYGVFSSKEGMNAAEAELRGKGLAAAALSSKDDYRIYAGMSTDRDAAALLSRTLSGLDVYVKPIEVPGLTMIHYAGAAGDARTFFEETAALLAKLDGMTIGKLGGPTSGDNDEWQALHQQWTVSAARMEKGMTDKPDQEALLKLVQAVNTAVVAAGEYGKKPSDAYLWTIQTALMEAVFIQKAWFASLESL